MIPGLGLFISIVDVDTGHVVFDDFVLSDPIAKNNVPGTPRPSELRANVVSEKPGEDDLEEVFDCDADEIVVPGKDTDEIEVAEEGTDDSDTMGGIEETGEVIDDTTALSDTLEKLELDDGIAAVTKFAAGPVIFDIAVVSTC